MTDTRPERSDANDDERSRHEAPRLAEGGRRAAWTLDAWLALIRDTSGGGAAQSFAIEQPERGDDQHDQRAQRTQL